MLEVLVVLMDVPSHLKVFCVPITLLGSDALNVHVTEQVFARTMAQSFQMWLIDHIYSFRTHKFLSIIQATMNLLLVLDCTLAVSLCI